MGILALALKLMSSLASKLERSRERVGEISSLEPRPALGGEDEVELAAIAAALAAHLSGVARRSRAVESMPRAWVMAWRARAVEGLREVAWRRGRIARERARS
ncbi:MAG: hypothetical protein QXU52_00575 [Fervidicoccaceae archaeon]